MKMYYAEYIEHSTETDENRAIFGRNGIGSDEEIITTDDKKKAIEAAVKKWNWLGREDKNHTEIIIYEFDMPNRNKVEFDNDDFFDEMIEQESKYAEEIIVIDSDEKAMILSSPISIKPKSASLAVDDSFMD